MKQYKTVKEVCALTGLTRKHLYYFHHENVVQAVAYANYSVEGYDGYKLYDDTAVEKLQQIALYYQLGLKRNEIRDIMLDPNYDANQVLARLLAQKRREKEKIERQIHALDYLTLIGIQNGLAGILRECTLEKLGQMLVESRNADISLVCLDASQISAFEKELNSLLSQIGHLTEVELSSPHGIYLTKALFKLCERYLGDAGVPFLWGLLTSAIGSGELADTARSFLTPEQSLAIIRCITKVQQQHMSEADPRVGV